LRVSFESAKIGSSQHEFIENAFTEMSERWMTKVVSEARRRYNFAIQAPCGAQGTLLRLTIFRKSPSDLSHLQAMDEPVVEDVALASPNDLPNSAEPAEC